MPYTGGLSNEYLFLTVLEAERSKIKVPAGFVSGESTLPSFQIAIGEEEEKRETGEREGEGEQEREREVFHLCLFLEGH